MAKLLVDSPSNSTEFSPTNNSNQKRKTKQDYVFLLWSKLIEKTNKVLTKENFNFDDLTAFITTKKTIELTANFWSVLSSFSKQTKLKPKTNEDNQKARIIFTALLISKFPNEILDINDIKNLDPLSEECYNNALTVTNFLFYSSNNNNVSYDNVTKLNCDKLVQIINNFNDIFISWKNKDSKKVLDSLKNYYKQWIRSKKMLLKTSMNESQRNSILKQIDVNINNTKKKILHIVKNENELNNICNKIDDEIKNEPELNYNNQQPVVNNTNNEEEKKEDNEEIYNNNNNNNNNNQLTMEQKLAAKGVPINIKTGRNLLKDVPKNPYQNNNNDNNNEEEIDRYIKDVNGSKMMDLSQIVLEEGSKKYWNDFEKEIENENYSRLFELLTELLQRIKKISPKKDQTHLDELIDVSFLQQTIVNKAIDAKGFYSIFYGIWLQIKSLHKPVEDNEWKQWHDMIYTEMCSSTASWSKILPKIFNKCFIKLDRIEEFINAFHSIKNIKK